MILAVSTRRCVALGVLAVLLGAIIFAAAARGLVGTQRLGASLRLEKVETNACFIAVTVVNGGKTDLTLGEADLPWYLVGDHITVAVIVEDHLLCPAINRSPFVADSPAGLVTLKAGQSLTHQVDLAVYYQGLMSALRRYDVTVLWLYRPQTADSRELPAIVGHMRIPCIAGYRISG